MARGIVLSLAGEESSFGFSKVEREKLYGKKDRVVVDENGLPCSSAYLTADGIALVPQGGAAYVYVDDRFDTVERSEMKGVDDQGQPLPLVPSTLGVVQPLTGPVPPERLLDHTTTVVYELSAETFGDTLRAALADGKLFETRFNYREDYADAPAFLLQNDSGTFLLVGQPTLFDFVRREALPAADTSDEDEAEELDFSML